jgi:hypothetical protein
VVSVRWGHSKKSDFKQNIDNSKENYSFVIVKASLPNNYN